jgi:hypothetical protein
LQSALVHHPTADIDGQGQHPGRPPLPHRRASNHPPSVSSNINDAPVLIGEAEVDMSVVLGGTDMDGALRAVE